MGIENTKDKQEQGVVKTPEQQEADPMAGLERATAEFGANTEKLDGLLKSEGGVDSLPPEEQGKFAALKERLLSQSENLKDLLKATGLVVGGMAVAGVGIYGLEEFRQSMELSKEMMIIGLADVAAIIAFVGTMSDSIMRRG